MGRRVVLSPGIVTGARVQIGLRAEHSAGRVRRDVQEGRGAPAAIAPYLHDMKRLGQLLTGLGATVGVLVAIAMLAHFGVNGAPWLVNVAMAKLGVIASLGLMAGGATSVRIANRREHSRSLRP